MPKSQVGSNCVFVMLTHDKILSNANHQYRPKGSQRVVL